MLLATHNVCANIGLKSEKYESSLRFSYPISLGPF